MNMEKEKDYNSNSSPIFTELLSRTPEGPEAWSIRGNKNISL
jgi:hypothetical protein